jgi:hypothetical protein
MDKQELFEKACKRFYESGLTTQEVTAYTAGYQQCHHDILDVVRKEIHSEYFQKMMFYKSLYEMLAEEKKLQQVKEALSI